MAQVNIHEAKTHLSRLVERAAAGEEIVIAKAGKPRVRLVPVVPEPGVSRFGGWEDMWLADDWDSDETNEEIARPFYERLYGDEDEPLAPERA